MSELSAFYTMLLHRRVAIPHGTSWLYNLASVPTVYTTSLYNLYLNLHDWSQLQNYFSSKIFSVIIF